MKKILSFLDKYTEEIICCSLLAVFSLLLIMQVFTRYVLNNSLSWTEELSRWLFVWMSYVGASYVVHTSHHMEVSGFVGALPKSVRKYFILLSELLFLFFSAFICYTSVQLVGNYMRSGQIAVAIHVPVWILYSSVMVGCFLMSIRNIQNIIKIIKTDFLKRGEEVSEE